MEVQGEPRRRRRWPRPRWLLPIALVLWAAACGATLLDASRDARRGIEAARRAERLLSPSDLVRGRALPHLLRARDLFGDAHRALDAPLVAPLKAVPVLGRQLRSATALAGAAADVSAAGGRGLSEARDAMEGPRSTGRERVAVLRELAATADRAGRALAGVELGPRRALAGPLARRRAEVAEQVGKARTAMAKAELVTAGLADLLTGPHRYLVLAANNAEMRAGSGMFLSVGELVFDGGEMNVDTLLPTADLGLDPSIAPPVEDADLAARWGWLNPNREWRNLGASPRFPPNAALASRMWAARGGSPTDGVMVLDPVALRGLLSSTGPVTVAGRAVSAENVLDLLLHEQYAAIEGAADPDQAARRELLGLIAQAVLAGVQRTGSDVGTLAGALGRAAAERHILAWAPDPATQRLWATAGVDGTLGERSLMVSVLNRGADKLDPYLDVESHLSLRRGRSHTEVELRVELRNRAPEGLSPYVTGIDRPGGGRPGDYVGLLSVNVPGSALGVKVDGEPPLAAAGPDGPTLVAAWPVRVDKGATVSQVVRFQLPGRHGRLVVEPSARAPAERWRAGRSTWESGARREVNW